MDIIHLILGKANPDRMNGVNKVVNSLATYQKSLGYNVTVWGITPNLEKNYPSRNYATKLFPALRNKLVIHQNIQDEINSLNRDTTFHIHGGFIPEFYHISKVLVKANISYVYTPHGAYNTVAMERKYFYKKCYFMLFEKYIAKHAKSIHCIGDSEVSATKSLGVSSACVLIPNGQNIEELNYQHKNIRTNSLPIFGFCGRLDIHTKGLDLLVEGFAKYIHEKNGSGELWLIGDGKEKSSLMSMVDKLHLSNYVKFWGKKFGEEKLNIMANMDAFFQPSRNEGLPGAVLEAAGLKIPCVVSKESNMADYVTTYACGVGLSSNNGLEIAKAMENVSQRFSSHSINEWKENAFTMVKESFDWSKIAAKLIQTY